MNSDENILIKHHDQQQRQVWIKDEEIHYFYFLGFFLILGVAVNVNEPDIFLYFFKYLFLVVLQIDTRLTLFDHLSF